MRIERNGIKVKNIPGGLRHFSCYISCSLTVRLLETSAGTPSSELLRLAPPRVSDQKGPVVLHEDVLDLLLGGLIHKFTVVGNNGLGDSLPDGVDLSSVSSSLDADADIEVGETLLAKEKDRLKGLKAEDLGLEELDGASVDLNEATALLAVSDSSGGLLAAENLDRLDGSRHCLRGRTEKGKNGGGERGGLEKVVGRQGQRLRCSSRPIGKANRANRMQKLKIKERLGGMG